MNIAYKGSFLREGLEDNGHQVFDLDLDECENLDAALKALPRPADLVVWEFYGGFSAIRKFSRCDAPVAAYCVDTPLNEFWLCACMKNLDYVFVDQPQCVESLAKNGVPASWLPLPAKKTWFQPKREKKHDITFIGTLSGLRQKRANLLNLVQSKFRVNIMSGIAIPEAQKIFAESKIILNENFFPGLTMRVLQGLSAGAIVFTEQSPYGHDFGLKDFVDLVYYNADNILERLSEVLDNHDKYVAIANQGQKKCGALYSCAHVAGELLSRIEAEGLRKRDVGQEDWIWNQASSELLYAQRYGGNFSGAMRLLTTVAESSLDRAAEAHVLISDIQARFKDIQLAEAHYKAIYDALPASMASLKLALLHIQANEPEAALEYIVSWIRNCQGKFRGNISDILNSGKEMRQNLLAAIAEIYFSLGRRWDMGFQKKFRDPVPETAFDVARMAWDEKPSQWALEMMKRCLKPCHMEGELLPYMMEGIKAGILPQRQLAEAAAIAYGYYDRDSAAKIVADMKKAG